MNFGAGPADLGSNEEEDEGEDVQEAADEGEEEDRPPKRPRTVPQENAEPVEANVSTETSTTEPVAPEDPLKRRKLIMITKEYFRRFPDRLEGVLPSKREVENGPLIYDTTSLDNKSVEELTEFLREVRFCIRCTSSGTMVQILIKGAAGVVESIGISGDVPLHGFQTELYGDGINKPGDKEWLDLCAEAELEYADLYEQPLWARLSAKLIETANMVRLKNQNLNNTVAVDNNPVPSTILQKLRSTTVLRN
jgi:hypothetical protein